VILNKPTAVLSGVLVAAAIVFKVGGSGASTHSPTAWLLSPRRLHSAARRRASLHPGADDIGGNVGLPYASFLLGAVDSASIATLPLLRAGNAPGVVCSGQLEGYTQDQHRYGLRWDTRFRSRDFRPRQRFNRPCQPSPAACWGHGVPRYGPGRCNCLFASPYPYAVARGWACVPDRSKTVLRVGWGITYGQTE